MALTDLVPWTRGRSATTQRLAEDRDPFLALHREMNRMFDDVARGLGAGVPARSGWTSPWPHVEVSETDKHVKLVAELPGLEEKDIDLSFDDGVLTLKGEKQTESQGALYSERWHGQFQRSLQLGPDADPEQVDASFKNGVLTVTVGKRPEEQRQVKRIAINKG